MARSVRSPSYLLHKSSGQARVRLRGRDYYLGPYNSPESWQKFHRLVAQYIATDQAPMVIPDEHPASVAELVAHYVEFAREHFRHNTEEKYRIRAAVAPLIEFYGSIATDDFSPKKLQDVRQRIIDRKHARTGKPLCRKYVNQLTSLIKKIFKWGVSQELVPVAVYQALDTVSGLRKGRAAGLIESRRVLPVPDEHITAVLPLLQPEVATMVQVQLHAGMRPDEVTPMKPHMIDRSGAIWIYTLVSRFDEAPGEAIGSKTDWLENFDHKTVLLGPACQELLRPFIDVVADDEFLFSPRRVCERLGKMNRSRPPRDRYDDESYAQAVERACKRAGIPKWTPGRLRHNAATRIRQKHGAEAARLVLGHRHLSTTEIYAERDTDRYRAIVAELG